MHVRGRRCRLLETPVEQTDAKTSADKSGGQQGHDLDIPARADGELKISGGRSEACVVIRLMPR